MNKINDCLVVIFDVEETTTQLSKLCFEKLGFQNVEIISGNDGFHEKFLKFAKKASKTNFEYFIRSDSDRLVFEGMVELVEKYKNSKEKNIDNLEGFGYDYFLNKFRGATPQLYTRNCLERLNNNHDLISNVPKPENYFGKKAKLNFKSNNIFTNLHDYGQLPSKACNSFVNRFIRDGLVHYDLNYINNLPDYYKKSFKHAYDLFSTGRLKEKNDMNYLDFQFLDKEYTCKIKDNLENAYEYYEEIYYNLKTRFNK